MTLSGCAKSRFWCTLRRNHKLYVSVFGASFHVGELSFCVSKSTHQRGGL